jgi:hypothetical protein
MSKLHWGQVIFFLLFKGPAPDCINYSVRESRAARINQYAELSCHSRRMMGPLYLSPGVKARANRNNSFSFKI